MSRASIEPNRRIRFGIRSMLVAVAVMAIALTWIGSEYRQISHESKVVANLKKLGAEVVYDVKRDGVLINRDDDASSSVLKKIYGADGANVNYLILNLPFVRKGKRNDQITDASMSDISTLTELRVLDLRGTAITDAGLAHIDTLSKLEMLLVTGTNITDAGIREFRKFNPDCEIHR